MKKQYVRLVFLMIVLMLITTLGGCSSKNECPIEVSVEQEFNPIIGGYLTVIKIISIVDEVYVSSMTVNRGNSRVKFEPKHLKFGQTSSTVIVARYDSIKEVEIETDLGTWTFTFNY